MGSGELTATMVEVHKKMLAGLPQPPRAVFLDTPAGFQLNVDEISRKATAFFEKHVQQTLTVASFEKRKPLTSTQILNDSKDTRPFGLRNPILHYPRTIQNYPSSILPLSDCWRYCWR